MIDHCVSAFLERKKEELFRVYVTDALKAAYHLNIRYADLFTPPETRTEEEIISSIRGKLRKLGGDNNEPIQPDGNVGVGLD